MDQKELLARLEDQNLSPNMLVQELRMESPEEGAATIALIGRLLCAVDAPQTHAMRARLEYLAQQLGAPATVRRSGSGDAADDRTMQRSQTLDKPGHDSPENRTRQRGDAGAHRLAIQASTNVRRDEPGLADDTQLRDRDTDPVWSGENHVVGLHAGSIVHDWYRLESMLGVGAMGQVWKALDLQRERTGDPQPHVALKLVGHEFSENPHALVALAREASKAQKLAHPNIATVFTFAVDPKLNQAYLAMELLEGKPLDRLIRENGSGLARERALGVIRGLAGGLANAHREGIVHCDFKPGNAFVTDAGVAKVLDFGIARLAQEVARAGDRFDAGVLRALTPPYASLEMLQDQDGTGKPHPGDDVYALGLVAYEVLSGRHPFGGKTAEEVLAGGLKPVPLKRVKRHEWRAIERALKLRRAERWPDAQAFLKALDGVSPWVPALAALAASLAAVAGYVSYQNHQESLPKVPFEQLPVAVQDEFRNSMSMGDNAYQAATTVLQGSEALRAVYTDALSSYAAAYDLHPKNPEADAAMRRSLEFLDANLETAERDVLEEAKSYLTDLQHNHKSMIKYPPLEDVIQTLAP